MRQQLPQLFAVTSFGHLGVDGYPPSVHEGAPGRFGCEVQGPGRRLTATGVGCDHDETGLIALELHRGSAPAATAPSAGLQHEHRATADARAKPATARRE
jgi:hypothetical protein